MDKDECEQHDEIGDDEGQARARAVSGMDGLVDEKTIVAEGGRALRGRDSRVVERRHRWLRYAALARLARPGGEGRRWGMLSAWPWKI
jgi:hypothetical protein